MVLLKDCEALHYAGSFIFQAGIEQIKHQKWFFVFAVSDKWGMWRVAYIEGALSVEVVKEISLKRRGYKNGDAQYQDSLSLSCLDFKLFSVKNMKIRLLLR